MLSPRIVSSACFQSHPVGQGVELQRVLFGLQGRSVLVAHFLKMRQLQVEEFHGKKVRHTRIAKLPYPLMAPKAVFTARRSDRF